MADAEKKTHKVRLIGTGMIYDKPYPGAPSLTIHVPAGATVEVDEATMNGWKKMNADTGRPTQEFEKLGAGETVDISIVDIERQVDAQLTGKGVDLTGVPTTPMVAGKYKGLFAGKGAPPPSAVDDDDADQDIDNQGGL